MSSQAGGSGYVVIRGWDTFQHPDALRSEHMPWLKLHTSLLGNDAWLELSMADRVLLQGLWMLTARYGNGRCKADQTWINGQLKVRKGSLDRLVQAGFITIRASKVASKKASKVASTEKEGSNEPKRESKKNIVELAARPDVQIVWKEYEQHHPQAVLTTGRRELIRRRLKDYDEATLITAIQGNHQDPYCNGENTDRKQYHSLELILRDADHIERYASIAQTPTNGRTTEAEMAVILQKAAERGH